MSLLQRTSLVNGDLTINQELFEALLAWLNPDREIAGQKYETVRTGLVRIFVAKGFSDAEDLADVTINRVIAKLPAIRDSYVGEPESYFRGVARKIILETRRRKEVATDELPELLSQMKGTSDEYDCLLKCLRLLPRDKRELILDYHLYEGQEKIVQHKLQAQEMGISKSNLRVQAHRIREGLEKCVLNCVGGLRREMNSSPASIVKEGPGHRRVNGEY